MFIFNFLKNVLDRINNVLKKIIDGINYFFEKLFENIPVFILILILFIIIFNQLIHLLRWIIVKLKDIFTSFFSFLGQLFHTVINPQNCKYIVITFLALIIIIYLVRKLYFLRSSKRQVTIDEKINRLENLLKTYDKFDNLEFNFDLGNFLTFFSINTLIALFGEFFYPKYKVNFDTGKLYLEKAQGITEIQKDEVFKEKESTLKTAIKYLNKFNGNENTDTDIDTNINVKEKKDLKLYKILGDAYYELAKLYKEKQSKNIQDIVDNVNSAIEYYNRQQKKDGSKKKFAELEEKQGDAYFLIAQNGFNSKNSIEKYINAIENYSYSNNKTDKDIDKNTATVKNKIAYTHINFIKTNLDDPDNSRRFEAIEENLNKADKLFVKIDCFCGHTVTKKLFGDYYSLMAKTGENPKKNYSEAISCYEEVKDCCKERKEDYTEEELKLKKWFIPDNENPNMRIGECYIELSKYTDKENNLDKAIKIFQDLEGDERQIRLAEIFELRAEINNSIEYTKKAISIYEALLYKFYSDSSSISERIDVHSLEFKQPPFKIEEIDIEEITVNKEKIQNENLSLNLTHCENLIHY